MIYITDCIRALSDEIEKEFGEAPITKDIVEESDRPCTYVYPSSMNSVVEGELLHDTFKFTIVRFAEKNYKGYLELLHYQIKLTEMLESPVHVTEDFFMYPKEISFDADIVSYALVAEFEVENVQLLTDEFADETENMQILEIENERNV